MKKRSKAEVREDIRPEYSLRKLLKGGTRSKYADRYKSGTNLVLLDPDVAKAFPTDAAVNEALRLVIRLGKLQGEGKARPPRRP
jgi:hypothetical protein